MIVTATVTETEAANQVLLFLADIFDGSKEELDEELSRLLIPGAGEEAEIADDVDEQKKLAAYFDALEKANTALAQSCGIIKDNTSTPFQKNQARTSIRSKLSSTNAASLSANGEEEFPDTSNAGIDALCSKVQT